MRGRTFYRSDTLLHVRETRQPLSVTEAKNASKIRSTSRRSISRRNQRQGWTKSDCDTRVQLGDELKDDVVKMLQEGSFFLGCLNGDPFRYREFTKPRGKPARPER
jgi:hypothetical protein